MISFCKGIDFKGIDFLRLACGSNINIKDRCISFA